MFHSNTSTHLFLVSYTQSLFVLRHFSGFHTLLVGYRCVGLLEAIKGTLLFLELDSKTVKLNFLTLGDLENEPIPKKLQCSFNNFWQENACNEQRVCLSKSSSPRVQSGRWGGATQRWGDTCRSAHPPISLVYNTAELIGVDVCAWAFFYIRFYEWSTLFGCTRNIKC